MKKVSNKITYLTMEILQEESWQPMAAPWHAESSLASKNYRREMTGMFKVNRMEGVLLTKSKHCFGDFCLLSMPRLFAISYCLGNQQFWHFKLEILYLFPRARLRLSWQRGLVIKSIRF